MAHFDKDFMEFFKELAANNNKDWFDLNRTRYKRSVKDPFDVFIADLIEEVRKEDSSIEIQAKDAIFRINRDIRFSKDKTIYKTNRSAIISPKGRKDKSFPGLYIELSPEYVRIYSGVYMPDKTQLYNIREAIVSDPKKLQNLRADKKFKDLFGEIKGEKNKIIPKEFKEAAEKDDLIYNKQFYWFTEMKPSAVLNTDFINVVMSAYQTNKAVMDYFAKSMV
jgi:uncharacterized protein (TIGR02453 family)